MLEVKTNAAKIFFATDVLTRVYKEGIRPPTLPPCPVCCILLSKSWESSKAWGGKFSKGRILEEP